MATKRMFSKDIVQSDAFLDMPASTQALYFHLGMECDDDGFVSNPKRLQRSLGYSDDDMKILLGKRFIITFESGVMVIKHHRINNNWDRHNSRATVYTEEFNMLFIKENKAYTLDPEKGLPAQTGYSLKPVFRGEERRGDKATKVASLPPSLTEVKLSPNGEEKPLKIKRDMAAWALREKLYDLFEDNTDVRPTPHAADYQMVVAALKTLNADEVVDLVEQAFESKKPPRTVREALSARQIDIYRQDNL